MSVFEDVVLFPVRIMMKLLWMMIPLFLIIGALMLLMNYPYELLGYVVGFLVAPIVLRKTGIYHLDANNAMEVISWKNQELEHMEEILRLDMENHSDGYREEEQGFQSEIQKIQDETTELDNQYIQLLNREPDTIVFYKPISVVQRIKNRLLGIKNGGIDNR
jgi:hypothetical protein